MNSNELIFRSILGCIFGDAVSRKTYILGPISGAVSKRNFEQIQVRSRTGHAAVSGLISGCVLVTLGHVFEDTRVSKNRCPYCTKPYFLRVWRVVFGVIFRVGTGVSPGN